MNWTHAMRAGSLLLALSATINPAAGPVAVDAGWLVAELRKGGYLVYFRHTSTYREEVETEDRNSKSGRLTLDDCATQRSFASGTEYPIFWPGIIAWLARNSGR